MVFVMMLVTKAGAMITVLVAEMVWMLKAAIKLAVIDVVTA
jgi:hypothetical protein